MMGVRVHRRHTKFRVGQRLKRGPRFVFSEKAVLTRRD
jgi:hypothetical protein